MRKMYFAMIPKRSFLEDALLLVGIGAGIVIGSKVLLGEDKYNEYVGKAKDWVNDKIGTSTGTSPSVRDGHNPVSSKFSETSTMGPDTGFGIDDDEENSKAAEQETIMDRIRRAAKQ